jgi:hypothetical protein
VPVVYRVAYTPVPDDPPDRRGLLPDGAYSTLVPYISPSGSAMSSSLAPLGSRK